MHFTTSMARMARLIRQLALVGLALFIGLTAARADATPPRAAADFAAIDAYVERQMGELRVPGLALGIVQGEQIVHLKGFGLADGAAQPVTPRAPFIIGSTTK